MDDQGIVNVVNQFAVQAEESRKPAKKNWDISWALFNQQYDFSSKEAWQHKVAIPKISGDVRTAVALFKQSLLRSNDWFMVDTPIRSLKDFTHFIFNNLNYWIQRVGFVNIFAESLHGALLTSMMIFKIYWVKDKKPNNPATDSIQRSGPIQTIKEDDARDRFERSGFLGEVLPDFSKKRDEDDGRLVVYAVDPYNFLIDPSGKNRYVIEDMMLDLDEFLDGSKGKGYDMSEVGKIEASYKRPTSEEVEEAKREGKTLLALDSRKKVKIREFWGFIPDEEGKPLYRNVTLTIANDRFLIRKPTENPFWSGKSPYVYGPVIRKPFSVWHKGFCDDLHGLQIAITDLTNVILDSNLISTIKAFELDVDQVADPEQFKNGIWPGKTYKKQGTSGMPGSNKMIEPLTIGSFAPQSPKVLAELDRQFQNESIITEFVSGGQGARGRATATEVVSKTNQATTLIQDIAIDVENFVMGPVLERMFQVCLQYQSNFSDERIAQFITEEMAATINLMTNDQKNEYLNDKFLFKVSGISGYINRISQIQKIQVFVQLLQYAPELLKRLKLHNFLKRIVEWVNWDPEEILYSDEEMQAMGGSIMAEGLGKGPGGLGAPEQNPLQEPPQDQGGGFGLI